jgi:hypothetical protein
VHIQLRCIERVAPAEVQTILPAMIEAAQNIGVDHSRLAATLDWVQYRRNFRAPVMVRPSFRPLIVFKCRDSLPRVA